MRDAADATGNITAGCGLVPKPISARTTWPQMESAVASDDPKMAGLSVVVSTLARSPSAADIGSPLPAPIRLLDTLQLGSVSRRLRSSLMSCEWKRKVDAAVHLQRVRGHAARLDTSERAKAQAGLVDDFLRMHGAHDWQRTPSSSDLQALVLLVAGFQAGSGRLRLRVPAEEAGLALPEGGVALRSRPRRCKVRRPREALRWKPAFFVGSWSRQGPTRMSWDCIRHSLQTATPRLASTWLLATCTTTCGDGVDTCHNMRRSTMPGSSRVVCVICIALVWRIGT